MYFFVLERVMMENSLATCG